MSYQVGIDLGTTFSAAAVCRSGGAPVVVPLGDRSVSVASVVFVGPDGSLVVGEAAARRALTDPDRVVREFKRRIGDETPLVVGGAPVAAEVVAARFVEWVLARVAEREGGAPSGVAVTHPAGWGPHKRELFASALAARGLDEVVFLSEPQAAAVGYASAERVEPGAVVGVYDLGGGTFDAAVVRKLVSGGFEVVGHPEGIERLGGVDFDEVVFEHVRGVLGSAWEGLDPEDPAVLSAVAGLRRECTAAKEALSADTEVVIPVMLPGVHTQVRLVRAEFEEMIHPAVEETVAALGRALRSAGLDAGGLDAVLLVGGSSRIPLIAQLVSAELGRPVAVDADPKTTTATGAALAARGTEVEETAVQDEPVVAAMPMSSAAVDQDDVAVTALPTRPPKATLRSRDEDEDSRPERSRVRALALAAAASVVAMIALAGTVGSGINPLGSTGGTGAEVAAAGAAPLSTDAAMPASGDGVDPWTGQPRAATTTPGPQRPNARAAVTPPGARTTSPTTNARPAPDGGGGTGATPTPRPLVDPGGPSGPGTGAEPSTTPPTEEPSATPPSGEPSTTPPTGESSATPRAGEPSTTPPSGESSATPRAGESSATPPSGESSAVPAP